MATKPSSNEEEYFAREDAEKKRKIALEQHKKFAEIERSELKKLHQNHCPNCGMELQPIRFREINIARCFNCNGTWLHPGTLEKIAGHEKGEMINSILAIFQAKP